MQTRRFTHNRELWIVYGFCLLLFALSIRLFAGVSGAAFWKVVVSAIVATGIFSWILTTWLRSALGRRDQAIDILNRVTAGDLSLTAPEIQNATQSERLAAALRAVVTNLERTIRRFSNLASDVAQTTGQISGRARILARNASEQLASAESTSNSVTEIDRSINNVRRSMQDLSGNAEETSTSILEMSASIEEVTRISEQLSEFVEQTSSGIEEMIASINAVATNTETFSSFTVQTASSIVQMNATSDEIGRSAKQSAELARYVKDAATEGREAVGGTVEGMRKIQQAVEEAKLALTELAERSEEIGEIVRVIDEIAGQTNLLALNAAIIAAQAGERGKGFAVVADEIRDLSERTSVSTDEIRTLIGNVQRSVGRAAEQMGVSADRVGEGVNLTARASQVLEKILELTDRSTSSISEIARATEEQTRGTSAATSAIEEVTKMVQQTASATQEQSQTSRKIGEQAAMVRDYTKHLKRAMTEQETGSKAISRAMQNIMALVQSVLDSISVLANESAAFVNAVRVIEQGSREASFGVSELNQMAGSMTHEANLLTHELERFTLPAPSKGGRITGATVLWQQLTLDPIQLGAAALQNIARPVHANLLTFGEGAELMPALAERWEVLEQGHVYRLHLRRNVRFHNGRTFEAKDVHDSFARLLDPANDSSGSWILRNVRGAADVMSGKSRTLAGVTVRDANTVDIQLDEPLAFFLPLLTMNEVAIIAPEDSRDSERVRLSPTGLGPFRVDDVVEGKHVRMRRFDDYYVPGEPHLDELVFRLDLRSGREVMDAFLRGELDVATGIPPKIAYELSQDPQYAPYMQTLVQLHTSYVGYDTSSPPFDKVEVRQAFNHAINRRRINDVVYAGQSLPAESLLPPGLVGYDPGLHGLAHDPERARALLRQAGYASGFAVEYRTWDTDEFNNSGLVPLMIEDLAAVGIRVNVTRHSATDARKGLQQRGHGAIFCGNWFADFPDSDNYFYVFFHSESTAIVGVNYHTDEIDRLIIEARQSNDPERRADIYRQLDRTVVKEAPIATLFHERLFVIHKPEVRGLRTYLVPPAVRYHDVWMEDGRR